MKWNKNLRFFLFFILFYVCVFLMREKKDEAFGSDWLGRRAWTWFRSPALPCARSTNVHTHTQSPAILRVSNLWTTAMNNKPRRKILFFFSPFFYVHRRSPCRSIVVVPQFHITTTKRRRRRRIYYIYCLFSFIMPRVKGHRRERRPKCRWTTVQVYAERLLSAWVETTKEKELSGSLALCALVVVQLGAFMFKSR